MASVNKVIIVGNLGRDPEVRYTPNGSAVCNVSVATTRSWKNKESGEKSEETEWHRVVFFDKLAEIAGEYLKKGRSVYVEGRLKTRKWTGQGRRREVHHRDRRHRHADARQPRRHGRHAPASDDGRRRLRALGAGGPARSGGGEPAGREVARASATWTTTSRSERVRVLAQQRRGAAVAADLERRDGPRVVAPRRAHVREQIGDVGVRQHVGERRHAERARVAGRRRREAAAQDDVDEVGGRRERDRAVAGQRRIGAGDAFAVARRGRRRNGSRTAWRRARWRAAAPRPRRRASRASAPGAGCAGTRPSPRGRHRSGTGSSGQPPRPSAPAASRAPRRRSSAAPRPRAAASRRRRLRRCPCSEGAYQFWIGIRPPARSSGPAVAPKTLRCEWQALQWPSVSTR